MKRNRIFGIALIAIALAIVLFLLWPFFDQYQTSRGIAEQDQTSGAISEEDQSPKSVYDKILLNGRVNIGVQQGSPPFNYTEKGKPTGFDYEFAKLLFSDDEFSGAQIDRESYTYTDSYDEVPKLLKQKSSKVDIVMGGLTFGDGDLDGVVYTEPYIDKFGYCLIAKRALEVNSYSDVINKKYRIGCVRGDTDVMSFIEETFSNQVVELSDEEDTWLLDHIEARTVDVIVYDFPFATVELENYESDLEIKIAKIPGSDIGYKIGIRDGDKRFLEKLNKTIKKVIETRNYEYDQLVKKYLSNDKVKVVTAKVGDLTYTVKEGDFLTSISAKCLKSKDRFTEIVELNNIGQPNLIFAGQELIMPRDCSCCTN